MSKTVRQLVHFLDPPGDNFKCPVCYKILQEPHLTTCCGSHHICRVCMERAKKANGRCPFCQQKPFSAFIDKRFERQLNELKVYCIYKSKGCDWIGNFGKIEHHLNLGKENGECEFVLVKCPVSVKCKEQFIRKNVRNHISNICMYRQVQCIYCGSVSTYQNISILHPTKCTKYPLICPNKCSEQTYPRNQLNIHLASCPEQQIDCTFSEIGCKQKVKRRHLQEHLDTNLLQHQLILCQAFKEIKKEKQVVEDEIKELKRDEKELEAKVQEMSKQEDNQTKTLKYIAKPNMQLQRTFFLKMAEYSTLYPVAPVTFEASFEITVHVSRENNCYHSYSDVRNIEHYTAAPYHSQLFYSHPNGYKLQLSAEIICHCSNCRKPPITGHDRCRPHPYQQVDDYGIASHDDVPSYYLRNQASFAFNLCILKGDHDSQLKWPFKEKVAITMYTEVDIDYHELVRKGIRDIPRFSYIPYAVAIFEGNQNYASTGSKLGVKQLEEPEPIDPQQLCSMLPSQHLFMQRETQTSVVSKEKGLLLPLSMNNSNHNSWYGNETLHNKFYFEVSFSPI